VGRSRWRCSRLIRPPQQAGQVVGGEVGGADPAERDGGADGRVLALDRAGEHAVQHGEHVGGGAVVVDEDGGEFVAPEPSGDSGAADVVGEAVGGRLQQRVPGGMPEAVVDLAEQTFISENPDREKSILEARLCVIE
jgi:hypothetical protein